MSLWLLTIIIITTSVNDLWNAIKDTCRECLNLMPSKESSTWYNQPWINSTVKHLSHKKQCCYNWACITGFTVDRLKYHQIKRENWHEYHKAFNNYIPNVVSTEEMCPTKKLWPYIKSQKQDFCGIGPLHVEDKTLTNSQDMADALNNFFASVLTHEDLSSWP